jgi:hypothetical protein
MGTVAAVSLLTALAAPAAGRLAADDVSVRVSLATTGSTGIGFTSGTKTSSLSFKIGADIESASGVVQTITLRIGLPQGLAWGADAPDPTEGCTGTAPAVCTRPLEAPLGGAVSLGFFWDVVAERPGFYEITATLEPTDVDPDLTNNTSTFRVEVVATAGGGGSGGSGGGGVATVKASAVRVAPARPRAGSSFTATVRVSAGGSPVRPTRVACTAKLDRATLRGVPRARVGTATCSYRSSAAAKGQTVRGMIAFSAKGSRITRRFMVRLT